LRLAPVAGAAKPVAEDIILQGTIEAIAVEASHQVPDRPSLQMV